MNPTLAPTQPRGCDPAEGCATAGNPDRTMVGYMLVNRADNFLTRDILGGAFTTRLPDWFTDDATRAAEFESSVRAIEVRDVLASMANPIMRDVLMQSTPVAVKYAHSDGKAMNDAGVRLERTALLVLGLMLEGCPSFMRRVAR